MKLNFSFFLIMVFLSLPVAAQDNTGNDSLGILNNYRFYDEPVNPDLYLIRPGEKLVITFLKTKLPQMWLQVNPEGKLIDQNLGMFDLAGKSLADVRDILYPQLKAMYNAEEIYISIREPYQVGIVVAGEIIKPDIYLGYTSFLVSELITFAGGVTPDGSTREIIFTGGKRDFKVDLDRVRYTGDNSLNPCLYAGSRLYVPRRTNNTVTMVGEVNSPRVIELLPDDNLELLLALAGGPTIMADVKAIHLANDPERDISKPGNFKAGDVILVPAREDAETRRLIIFGRVNYPGWYNYENDMTLKNLVEVAGGLGEKANFQNTTIFRKVEKSKWVQLSEFRFPISKNSVTDISFENYSLKPGDSVFVPPEVGFVKVSGYVQHSGFFPFNEGKNALYYINLAGGFQKDADRNTIKIFDRVSETTRLTTNEITVDDGDEVIIEAIEMKP